ncbi:MAG: response regulator [Proteobacteria bacterium]|nr:response regulator [Pseudomonadota bacterium]
MDDKITILVVDDEKGIREGCRRILASEGFDVNVAANGKEGLEMVMARPYDLMLVDLMMPGMGGLEMMEQVRKIDPEIIMIVITGFATIETAVNAMKRGAYDYIPKPFTPDQLLAFVNRGLEKRRLSIQAKRLMEERDQKLLEVANERSKTHTIINSIADGILVINRERQLVLFNPAAIKMLALGGKLEPGKDISEIIMNGDLIRIIEKGFSSESSQYTMLSEEVELSTPINKTLMVNVSKVRDEMGQDFGVVSTMRDITSLKEINQIKSQFVAMVTHELRAPLSAIEGYLSAYLTQAAGSDPQMYKQMMERAKQRAHSLLELINDLLQYSRLEVKSVARKKEPLNISDIILSTVELLKMQGTAKNLKFETDVTEQLPLIEADRTEMEQLITNLVSNAIKYNVKNGKVIINARPDGNFLHITVADTGIGIDKESLPCIFDEFYRVCGPDTRYVTGTGLGLSIVKKIVESHFGHITIDSKVGKGTAFTVMLPIQQGKESK